MLFYLWLIKISDAWLSVGEGYALDIVMAAPPQRLDNDKPSAGAGRRLLVAQLLDTIRLADLELQHNEKAIFNLCVIM